MNSKSNHIVRLLIKYYLCLISIIKVLIILIKLCNLMLIKLEIKN